MSRYQEYVPNERIVDRACALWVAMLKNPRYDNLGEDSPESPESIFANKMSSVLAAAIPKNNNDTILAAFAAALKRRLMEGEPSTGGGKRYHSYFSVDYGPDKILSDSAQEAGLKMEFPWKTTMSLGADYVSVGYGYGAPYVYHYPLSNDRWLETTLSGRDIKKVIDLVERGILDTKLQPPVPA